MTQLWLCVFLFVQGRAHQKIRGRQKSSSIRGCQTVRLFVIFTLITKILVKTSWILPITTFTYNLLAWKIGLITLQVSYCLDIKINQWFIAIFIWLRYIKNDLFLPFLVVLFRCPQIWVWLTSFCWELQQRAAGSCSQCCSRFCSNCSLTRYH